MTVRSPAVLYTPEILALAVELADHPLTGTADLYGEAVSRVCGSKVAIALSLDADGAIERAGARVTACAIGQAAAALFLRSASGRSPDDIAVALAAIEDWLGSAGFQLRSPVHDRHRSHGREYP